MAKRLEERTLYEPIAGWLEAFLISRYPDATIVVRDTSQETLSDAIRRLGLENQAPPEWQTFEIEVDVTGFIIFGEALLFAFVEVKTSLLTLRDAAQLLGYSRVAQPTHSYLVSPQGVGTRLHDLIQTYGRTSVLEYAWNAGEPPRTLILAQWDLRATTIAAESVLPHGNWWHLSGKGHLV